jgi:meso-butanediol dehydrogenase / (S,S)-butanediol dehydrogenase / diacetyl reductase
MAGILEGKAALITGGGTGIGEACARLFADGGARVAVMGRRPAPLQAVAADIGGLAVPGDASRPEDCERAVATAVAEFGRLDILVCCAGIEAEGSVAAMDLGDWRRVMDANLEAVMQAARACIAAMLESGGGSIVNVSSLAGLVAPGNMAAYITSKTAVLGLTRSLAVDYGPQGIRVNTLCPGWVRTPMSRDEMRMYAESKGVTPDEAVAYATRYLPLGRMAEPVEIARCARFLASDDASFVTGTTLVADGGSAAVDVGYVSLL